MKIGDFLTRIKVPAVINPDKTYKLVTVKLYHKGVLLREEKKGSELGSKMYKVKAGQFILSGIDARNGAFGIIPDELDGAVVTNDFWCFDIDNKVIDKKLFLYLTATDYFDEICRQCSDGTTNRVRLQADKFFGKEIALPDIDSQKIILPRLTTTDRKSKELSMEVMKQTELLTKLRQSILQDAVQGKLIEQDPKDEPASIFLKNIATLKEKLIKEGKLKKEKTFLPIKDGSLFTNCPESWDWCIFKDIFKFIDYRGKTPIKSKSGIRLITAKNIRNGYVDENPIEYMSKELYKKWMVRGFPNKDDLLFVTEGHTMGFVAIVDMDYTFALAQRTITLQPYYYNYAKFIYYLIMSPIFQELLIKQATGSAAMGIQSAKLKRLLIPFPPIEEQKRIVAKVESLMSMCNELEQQITQSKEHAGLLMQSVLQEAFTN